MRKKENKIDGISIENWDVIKNYANQYPKPVRYAENSSARIAILNFYNSRIHVNGKYGYEMIETGRIFSIAYKFYNSSDGEITRSTALNLLHTLTDKYLNYP